MFRRSLITVCLTAMTTLTSSAQEFYDLTEYYLQNSLFDSNFDYTASQTGNVAEEQLPVEGWTAAHTAGYTITGVYQIGTKKTFNNASVPATNADGTNTGGVLALSTGWEQSLIFQQSMSLPAGTYKLISAYYNGDASKTAGSSLLGWIPSTGTSTLSKVTSFAVGKWVVDTLTFTLAATRAGKIQIGFKGAAGGSANSAKISVDYVKLMRNTPFGDTDISIYKAKLNTLISTARGQYGTGTKRGAAALKTAIDNAQDVYDNASVTFKQIDDVYNKLQAAIDTFKALQTADSALKALLTTANATANKAPEGEAVELLQAIGLAQAVYDNADATVEQLTAATTALQTALDTYNYSHPTGAIPTVTTDKRFVRGATMAFGRMTVNANGATIKTRGFCCSENPEPTINDIVSKKTLQNNGLIYWLQDLKPATKYYMRAYVVTAGYQVAYGEPIKFYTIPMGNVTYTYSNGGDAATNQRINTALEQACYYFNNMIYTERKYNVDYSPGTPTADCNYTTVNHMNIGPNTSYQRCGTVMHEMEHGLGLQNYSTQWSKNILRSGDGTGYWLGDRVAEALHFWDNNTTTRLNGDKIHMWPYGINGANEDNGSEVLYLANAMICQALGEDGLEHDYARHADPYYALEQEDDVKYYLTNESASRGLYTAYLKPTAAGVLKWVEMTAEEAVQNDSVAWYFTFTPSNQYYQIRNAATGQYITYTNGIRTATKSSLTANENWHLMKGRVDVDGQRGYWIIHPTSNWTPPCLQANANGATGAVTFNIANSAVAQRWLIMTMDETRAAEVKAIAKAKAQAQDLLKKIKELMAVPHTENVAGTDQGINNTVSTLEARINTASTTTELNAIISEARTATTQFLENVTATDREKPFDLTYMMNNASLTDGTEGWNGAGTFNYGAVEFYQATFDFNQTVTQLPAGTYQFCAQGFQRPGTTATSYSDYTAGNNNVTAYIYAGSKNQKLCHICDTMLNTKVGVGNESTAGGKYVPNDMQSASAYFAKKLYENRLATELTTSNASLKMGIRSSNMGTSYWAIFNNFRLYFYGKMSIETLGIETLNPESATQQGRKGIYTLDGRRMNSDAQLRSGLYIIDGRKVVVK